MSEQSRPTKQMLQDAFNHLQSALDLLDATDAPGTIAAHIDLGTRQLEDLIAGTCMSTAKRHAANWNCDATLFS